MDLIQAILMGIVQGLSEFLPISSSAHLVFTSNFYKIFKGMEILQNTNQEVFLDIMLHIGTLIAVLIYFRKELWVIIKAIFRGMSIKESPSKDFMTGIYIIIGTAITVIVAYALCGISENLVFRPDIVGVLLVVTGIALLSSEYFASKIKYKKDVTLKTALLIGLAQGLASIPGFSRSGWTIAAGLLGGVERTNAAQYSFLLSIPIILGASIFYPLLKIDFTETVGYNWSAIIIGTLVSGVVGYICIKCFMQFLSKFSLSVFGFYCIIIGIIAAVFFKII